MPNGVFQAHMLCSGDDTIEYLVVSFLVRMQQETGGAPELDDLTVKAHTSCSPFPITVPKHYSVERVLNRYVGICRFISQTGDLALDMALPIEVLQAAMNQAVQQVPPPAGPPASKRHERAASAPPSAKRPQKDA